MRTAQRHLVRRLSPAARKRIAAALPGRFLASYRRHRTDVYLVSFPKCGRTWLRVMIGRAFQLHFDLPADADLVELHRLAELDRAGAVRRSPPTTTTPSGRRPRTSSATSPATGTDAVILLVRDPAT